MYQTTNLKPSISRILKNLTDKEKTLVVKAFDFASKAHKNQKRASGEPYITHPIKAAEFLANLRLDGETIAAALLHDVVEDTVVTGEEIEKEFGKEVAFLVDSVTKLKELSYKEEANIGQSQNLKAQTLRRMFFAMAKDLRVILIKLADRIHNIRTLKYLSQEDAHRIALETIEIYAPMAERLGMGHLKGELEDLSFPYAYPEEYKFILERVKETREERMKYLSALIPKIKKIIENRDIKITDIHHRAKHYYSLYKKILARDMDIGQIYDLIALRIILPSVEDCYAALGTIHTYYKPLVGLIKDYIALPRPNGYQSLHTTIFCDDGKIVEIQLRTPKMHNYAENGIAAHWAYSESGKSKTQIAAAREVKWINKLRNALKEEEPKELIKNLKIDFFKHRIYVFTPKGDVIDLPEGATPLDVAYAIHTQIGETTGGAKVNGKMVALSYELQNGNIVEILKSKNAKSSRDWFSMVKTSFAKKKIKSWFTKYDSSSQIKSRENLPDISDKIKKVKAHPLANKAPSFAAAQVIIGGQEKIAAHLAKCCNPRPPEAINGYITKKQKISVHKKDCPQVKRKNRERIIGAGWNAEFESQNLASYPVVLTMKVKDRIGMLKDISDILAKLKINIKEIKNIPAGAGRQEIKLALDIKNATQIRTARRKLETIQNVISVERV